MITLEMVNESVDYIRERLGERPAEADIAIVFGSGLNALGELVEDAVRIPYDDVPHFRVSGAPGHEGCLILGTIAGRRVLCMQGRLHLYEDGYGVEDVVFPTYVMAALGVKSVIHTNAAGAINYGFNVGDIMLVTDHINFTGEFPTRVPGDKRIGANPFPDLTELYTPRLRDVAHAAAAAVGEELREGVYIACHGPSFETPAEIRAFRIWGADAVGMSTVNEAIMAAALGLEVCVLSVMTNLAAGMAKSLDEFGGYLEISRRASVKLAQILAHMVANC